MQLYTLQNKILEISKSYDNPDHEIIGAFKDEVGVGMVEMFKTSSSMIIYRISAL